ncbi:tRNA N6-adenosine threonylcarbamoyltransferase-like [Zophobas morio]|uniref:tRNA N6-adenosine threonylcarbamoyltransferase-like n=1 Tax=Zophobas morio TaxID=2755281 RepID=UPI003082A3E5
MELTNLYSSGYKKLNKHLLYTLWNNVGYTTSNINCKEALLVKFHSVNSRLYNNYLVLGIETSCDDTGIAILDSQGKVLSHVKRNYWETLRENWGGINPVKAKIMHENHIHNLLKECLAQAGVCLKDIDVVGVTQGPGLGACLGVGLALAKEIVKEDSNKLLMGVHHLEAHLLTSRLTDFIEFPFIALLVSGGNCQLILASDVGDYSMLGYTLDSAPGDVFDKVARAMNLSNGAELEQLAKSSTESLQGPKILGTYRNCHFSFAGLRSWASGCLEDFGPAVTEIQKANVAAAFQEAVINHLMIRLARAINYCDFYRRTPIKSVVLSGGVASNESIRVNIAKLCRIYNKTFFVPPKELCTDNGVMIAWTTIERIRFNKFDKLNEEQIQKLQYRIDWPLGADESEFVEKCKIRIRTRTFEHSK